MSLTRTLDAASEALSLTEVKNQLRIATSTADHDAFRMFIAAIRHRTETFLGKTLITSTWEYTLDEWPEDDLICLPMGPVQSITTIAYTDTAGNPQTFTDFQFDSSGRLMPDVGFSWPGVQSNKLDAITITYVAGQLTAGEVQEDIKYAMLLWIGACDVARENVVIGAGLAVSEIPKGAECILAPYRRQLV
jgi:uncharacterized phiE125 gp8 family phage protein